MAQNQHQMEVMQQQFQQTLEILLKNYLRNNS